MCKSSSSAIGQNHHFTSVICAAFGITAVFIILWKVVFNFNVCLVAKQGPQECLQGCQLISKPLGRLGLENLLKQTRRKEDDDGWRYLITFVNCEAANEWWQLLSTQPNTWNGKVKWISPQFYTHDLEPLNIGREFFTHDDFPAAREFLNKMFTILLNDKGGRILFVTPPIKITDHISGRWYFIWSQTDMQKYWYCCVDGTCLVCGNTDCDVIHVSTWPECCLRFCMCAHVTANQNHHVPKDFVMIGSDDIYILAFKDYILHINDEEDLKVTKNQGTSDLLFSDLKDRFLSKTEKQENGGMIYEYVVLVERGLKQAWELVD
ncbi:hypothetical protein HD554DRAFT_2238915 [Boletus coccyginus]|nr:hypothetical protein HD554DRAFT_2238915 [Boletus coccyginus]